MNGFDNIRLTFNNCAFPLTFVAFSAKNKIMLSTTHLFDNDVHLFNGNAVSIDGQMSKLLNVSVYDKLFSCLTLKQQL